MAYETTQRTYDKIAGERSYAGKETARYSTTSTLPLFSGNDFTCQGMCRSTVGCTCGKRPGVREQ